MTQTVVDTAARAAARRLAAGEPTCARLPDEVDVALRGREFRSRGPEQYADPTALGGLVVSIATLAWTIWNDIRSRTSTSPTTEVVTRRVRYELERTGEGAGAQDRVVAITVEETVAAAREAAEDGEA
jgi:hypothetical protein